MPVELAVEGKGSPCNPPWPALWKRDDVLPCPPATRQSFRRRAITVFGCGGGMHVGHQPVLGCPKFVNAATLAIGRRQLVVKEAFGDDNLRRPCCLWFTPITNIGGARLYDGAERNHFFLSLPSMCARAWQSVRNRPWPLRTISAPTIPPVQLAGIALACHGGMLRPLNDQLAIADRHLPF